MSTWVEIGGSGGVKVIPIDSGWREDDDEVDGVRIRGDSGVKGGPGRPREE